MKRVALLVFLGLIVATAADAGDPFLYRVITIRAAPGEFAAWLDQVGAIRAAYVERGDAAPFVLRHTQGDHWDLMILEPAPSSPSRGRDFGALCDFQDDVFDQRANVHRFQVAPFLARETQEGANPLVDLSDLCSR